MKSLRTLAIVSASSAMFLFAYAPQIRADDAPSTAPAAAPAVQPTGTLSITVTDADGKPVADAKVRLIKASDLPNGEKGIGKALGKGGKHGGKGKGKNGAPGDNAQPGPLANSIEATAGADGKYTATAPAGDYVVIAMEKGAGRGHSNATVTVNASTDVAISLKPHQGGGKNGGKKGQAPAAN